ncbi:MAG: dTMP kinase [Planctomycetes bacterium]|nr:dTMP kinase [Planctomycetota bacterium]MBU1517453.1 dTMP kinase [Planctomycetota bacterium]MBU2457052.1 dTMP kinase [Planctomycetota bacterium]MBU2596486.1 dTMP kinase [Planctomycetota bacterium]
MVKGLKSRFIVLDGPDGCGKSTQIKLLGEYLNNIGFEVVTTNDPGGTPIGDQIRHLLKYGAKSKMDVHTELMLFMASRSQLLADVILPALKDYKVVLCDRFVSATCAYQGAGGYDVKKVIDLAKFVINDCWPDLTIILDLPVEEGRLRIGHKPHQRTKTNHEDAYQSYLPEFENATTDLFDSRTVEYHRKVRKIFQKLQDYYPNPVEILNVSEISPLEVNKKIIQIINKYFNS